MNAPEDRLPVSPGRFGLPGPLSGSLAVAPLVFLLLLALLLLAPAVQAQQPETSTFQTSLDRLEEPLSLGGFETPPLGYGPWIYWAWPGGDVTEKELRRELGLFKDKGIAGVHIHPFGGGIAPELLTSEDADVLDYDTPAFWRKVGAVMEEARALGLQVDLNVNSGWPGGGPHISPDENLKGLFYEATQVSGPSLDVAVPTLTKPPGYVSDTATSSAEEYSPVAPQVYHPEEARRLAVVAAKVLAGRRTGDGGGADRSGPVRLDSETATVVTGAVENGRLRWEAPSGGRWQIVAVYGMPSGQRPSFTVFQPEGYVVDYFDAESIIGHYNDQLGAGTGLPEYYGDPFRAFYNDSFEILVNRLYAEGVLEAFRERRGYDLTPFLPGVIESGYDNSYVAASSGGWRSKPAFLLQGEANGRLQYDYSRTLSELFVEEFLEPSLAWAEERDLLFRGQHYGIKVDLIAAAGHTDLPETEILKAGGAELFLKMVASGAHLYGRPLILSEALDFGGRLYMDTPQKMKVEYDKLFDAGVNQVIPSVTPYQWDQEGYGETGWHPYSSQYYPDLRFSPNLSEASPFWPYLGEVHRYVGRVQSLLQRGEPEADVLVYYPFLGFPSAIEHASDHEELFFRGYLPGVEPTSAEIGRPAGRPADSLGRRVAWLERAWALVQALDRRGYDWDWANDEMLAEAQWRDGALEAGQMRYAAVLVPEAPWMRPEAARRLEELAGQGAPVLVAGAPPQRQPGYHDWQAGDRAVAASFTGVLEAESGEQVAGAEALGGAVSRLDHGGLVRYARPHETLRMVRRALGGEMEGEAEGEQEAEVAFLRNASPEGTDFALEVTGQAARCLWLDATDGRVWETEPTAEGRLEGRLSGYGSMLLACGGGEAFAAGGVLAGLAGSEDKQAPSAGSGLAREGEVVRRLALEQWDVSIVGEDVPGGTFEAEDTELFDWRDREELKHVSSAGVYRAEVTLAEAPQEGRRYVLELGEVYFVAEVMVNGEAAGTALYAPYAVEIGKHLKAGRNEVTVRVVPSLRNRLIGRGTGGEEEYRQFAEAGGTELPAGLVGPVVLNVLQTQ